MAGETEDMFGDIPKNRMIPYMLKLSALRNNPILEAEEVVIGANTSANTPFIIDSIVKPDVPRRIYMILVENPSEESKLDVTPYNLIGDSAFPLGSFECPLSPDLLSPDTENQNGSIAKLVHGLFFTGDSNIVLSPKDNVTTGFTAKVWIYEAD